MRTRVMCDGLGYVVSTVRLQFGSCPYETMVFRAKHGTADPLDYEDVDSEQYDCRRDAAIGHRDMVKRWSGL
jgi:hypothetical protein